MEDTSWHEPLYVYNIYSAYSCCIECCVFVVVVLVVASIECVVFTLAASAHIPHLRHSSPQSLTRLFNTHTRSVVSFHAFRHWAFAFGPRQPCFQQAVCTHDSLSLYKCGHTIHNARYTVTARSELKDDIILMIFHSLGRLCSSSHLLSRFLTPTHRRYGLPPPPNSTLWTGTRAHKIMGLSRQSRVA